MPPRLPTHKRPGLRIVQNSKQEEDGWEQKETRRGIGREQKDEFTFPFSSPTCFLHLSQGFLTYLVDCSISAAAMDWPASPLSSPPSTSRGSSRALTDLNADALTHCASFLDLQDLSNLAMTSNQLRQAAYSDSIWRRLFRRRWPKQFVPSGISGVREAYLARHVALQQFKFDNPWVIHYTMHEVPPSHILLNKNDIIVAQGAVVQMLRISTSLAEMATYETLRAHNATITCMRLFPLSDTSLFWSGVQNHENVLVTSSSDRTIRLWWKGRSRRCFKGHSRPVRTLADRLLGDCGAKVLASGGDDCTVRLWSFSSTGKRHPLTTTLYGHEKPVSLLSVARHNPSLLVSISEDGKIRVWDTTASPISRSSSCVGMTSVSGHPVGLKCHETLCYIASGSSVTAIDLRTMKKAFTAAFHPSVLYSFEMLPSKSLICTGGEDKAMLWDIRKSHEKTGPVADLDGHSGHVSMIHMDPYKVVTGGPHDFYVKVWETDTGTLTNSLECCIPDEPAAAIGLSAMAVDGCRIVTGGSEQAGLIYLRDFSNSSIPVSSRECYPSSKFWEP